MQIHYYISLIFLTLIFVSSCKTTADSSELSSTSSEHQKHYQQLWQQEWNKLPDNLKADIKDLAIQAKELVAEYTYPELAKKMEDMSILLYTKQSLSGLENYDDEFGYLLILMEYIFIRERVENEFPNLVKNTYDKLFGDRDSRYFSEIPLDSFSSKSYSSGLLTSSIIGVGGIIIGGLVIAQALKLHANIGVKQYLSRVFASPHRGSELIALKVPNNSYEFVFHLRLSPVDDSKVIVNEAPEAILKSFDSSNSFASYQVFRRKEGLNINTTNNYQGDITHKLRIFSTELDNYLGRVDDLYLETNKIGVSNQVSYPSPISSDFYEKLSLKNSLTTKIIDDEISRLRKINAEMQTTSVEVKRRLEQRDKNNSITNLTAGTTASFYFVIRHIIGIASNVSN